MALKKSLVTVGNKWLLELDSAPNVGDGFPAPIGSEARVSVAGVGTEWIKFGSGNTDWREEIDSATIKADKDKVSYASDHILVVSKTPTAWEYSSAIHAITTLGLLPSLTNRYLIAYRPGVFEEPDEVILPLGLSVIGSSINTTTVKPADPTKHLFRMTTLNEISFLNLEGHVDSIGSGKCAIIAEDAEDFAQLHKLSIYNFDIPILNYANTKDSVLYSEYCDINGDYSYAVKNIGNGTYLARFQAENFYTYPSTIEGAVHIHSSGLNAELITNSIGLLGGPNNIGFQLSNGTSASVSDTLVRNFSGVSGVGLSNLNSGSGSVIDFGSSQFLNNTTDISIANPSSQITITTIADPAKIFFAEGVQVSASISDSALGGIVTIGEIRQGDKLSNLTPIGTLISKTGTTGSYEGGSLSTSGGLSITVSAGKGFCYESSGDYMKHVIWSETTLSGLTANTTYWISVNSSGVVAVETSNPGLINKIYLARIRTGTSSILWIGRALMKSLHHGNDLETFARNMGSIYLSGSRVSENGTRGINITSGVYQYGTTIISPSGGTLISWVSVYKNGLGDFTFTSGITQLDNTTYDDGSGTPATMTTDYYRRDAVYTSGSGVNEKIFIVKGQVEFSSLVLAQAGEIPLPPDWFSGTICLIASIIIQKDDTNFTEIKDERPTLAFKASGISGTTSHSELNNKDADDHPQYLAVNGLRAMANHLSMGGFNITNINLLNGVSITGLQSQVNSIASNNFAKTFNLYATTSFQTGNATKTLITAFSITPNEAGTYDTSFNLTVSSSNQNANIRASIYKNNVEVADTEMVIITGSTNARLQFSGEGSVSVNGTTDVVDIRISTTIGTVTVTNRTLKMMRTA